MFWDALNETQPAAMNHEIVIGIMVYEKLHAYKKAFG